MSKITYDMPRAANGFESAAQRSGAIHRELLYGVPRGSRWRGCLGLAMLVTDPAGGVCRNGRLFVPDRHVRWISLIDLPPGTFHVRRRKEVQWAAVYRTHVRFGMPNVAGVPILTCDFLRPSPAQLPSGRWAARRHVDGLDPVRDGHVFRTLDAINWAMTSAAIHLPAWRAHRNAVRRAMDEFSERTSGRLPVSVRAAPPKAWMPRAFLAFPDSHRSSIYAWATPRGAAGGRPYYPPALRQQLFEDVEHGLPVHAPATARYTSAVRSTAYGLRTFDLVFDTGGDLVRVRVTRHARVHVTPGQRVTEGDLVASDAPDLPAGWQGLSPTGRWDRVLPRLVGPSRFDRWLRLWFDRQLVQLRPGLIHAPADLAAPAALARAVDAELFWDVTSAMDYYCDSEDAFIFPPLPLAAWWHLRGVLPGDVLYDFSPTHPCFRPRHSRPRHPRGPLTTGRSVRR